MSGFSAMAFFLGFLTLILLVTAGPASNITDSNILLPEPLSGSQGTGAIHLMTICDEDNLRGGCSFLSGQFFTCYDIDISMNDRVNSVIKGDHPLLRYCDLFEDTMCRGEYFRARHYQKWNLQTHEYFNLGDSHFADRASSFRCIGW